MKINAINHSYILLLLICIAVTTGCQQTNSISNKPVTKEKETAVSKPCSSFTDTLDILVPAAIFFEPDSMQLQKIKAVTKAQVFEGSMHEYAYQIKNAAGYIKSQWPELKTITVKNARYLRFPLADTLPVVIDLDKEAPCGMFVYDGKTSPVLMDMTNIETQVTYYMRKDAGREIRKN
jgi:hypothetical protein